MDPSRSHIYWRTIGSGPAMFLLHGGMGLDHTLFRPWLDPLAAQASITFFDFSGNGRSRTPESLVTALDHAEWVADIDAIRRAQHEERIWLLGHSYGGFVALEYALAHPERVAGLILVATAPDLAHLGSVVDRAMRESAAPVCAGLTELLADGPLTDATFGAAFAAVLPLYFHRYDPAIGQRLLAELAPAAATYQHAFANCVPQYEVHSRLGTIHVPTLVISGRSDWIMPVAHGGARIAAAIPGARHLIFDQSGHFPYVEETARFLREVEQFLREFGARSA